MTKDADHLSCVLLTAAQMRSTEEQAMAAGAASLELMERAGEGVARIVMTAWTKRPVAVVCGPGNNGGDGFVAARYLKEAGWPVEVFLLGDQAKLKGDAKLNAERWGGKIKKAKGSGYASALVKAGLIIDALFGTGLARALDGDAAEAVRAMNTSAAPTLAVDLPSGIDTDTGAIMGTCVDAARTVTFFLRKPGHLLYHGRRFAGAVDVVDIGIDYKAVRGIAVTRFENHPDLWGRKLARPDWSVHKYHRGSVFVMSGARHQTGAARLAAMAAQRAGAGLVTMLSSKQAADINAGHLTSIMLRTVEGHADVVAALSEKPQYTRIGVIGPAAGVGEATRENTLAMLGASSSVVVDADALTSFEETPDALFAALHEDDVITPHAGEFARLFPDLSGLSRIEAAAEAAARAGCICVLKGADTIIASADGRAAITSDAPGDLASAGSGDVLAGFIAGMAAGGAPDVVGGLEAEKLDGFEAACAGVWLHGAAGRAAGPGLIAEDLVSAAPGALAALYEVTANSKERDVS